MTAPAQIFLSYAREDRKGVEKLYQRLSEAGFTPWMDTKDIHPGEKWQPRIQEAIRQSHFFLACLSTRSVNKRGFIRREFQDAVEKVKEMLESVTNCLSASEWDKKTSAGSIQLPLR